MAVLQRLVARCKPSDVSVNLTEIETEVEQLLGGSIAHEELFEKSASDWVGDVLDGQSLTILVYGLPCSGKSYTVFGSPGETRTNPSARGIIVRCFEEFTKRLARRDKIAEVKGCLYHISSDGQIADLIDARKRNLQTKKSPNNSYTVPDASQQILTSVQDVVKIVEKAMMMRNVTGVIRKEKKTATHPHTTVHNTNPLKEYRQHSTHAIFQYTIESCTADTTNDNITSTVGLQQKQATNITQSTLTIIDLAGNDIHSFHEHAIDCKDIGLIALHSTLTALSLESPSAAESCQSSSLTRLLYSCFFGSSRCLLINTLSLESTNETLVKKCLKMCQGIRYSKASSSPPFNVNITDSSLDVKLKQINDHKKAILQELGHDDSKVSTVEIISATAIKVNGEVLEQLNSDCQEKIAAIRHLESQILSPRIKETQPLKQPPIPVTTMITSDVLSSPQKPLVALPPLKLNKLPSSPSPLPTPIPISSQVSKDHNVSSEESSSSDSEVDDNPADGNDAPPPLKDIPHILPTSPTRKLLETLPKLPTTASTNIFPVPLQKKNMIEIHTNLPQREALPYHNMTPLSPTNGTVMPPLSPTNGTIMPSLSPTIMPPLPPTDGTIMSPLSPTNGTFMPPLSPTDGTIMPPLSPTNGGIVAPFSPTKGTRMAPLSPTNCTIMPPINKYTKPKPLSPTNSTMMKLPVSHDSSSSSSSPNIQEVQRKRKPKKRTRNRSPLPLPSPVKHVPNTKLFLPSSTSEDDSSAEDKFDPSFKPGKLSFSPQKMQPNRSSNIQQLTLNSTNAPSNVTVPLLPAYEESGHSAQTTDHDTGESASGHELHQSVLLGDKSSVIKKLVMKYGVDYRDQGGRTALMYSVLGNHPKLTEILISMGAEVDAVDSSHLTALFWAVYQARSEVIKTLLKNGANIFITDPQMRTVFHWVMRTTNVSCLKILCKYASRDIQNKMDCEGLTPLHWAVMCEQSQHITTLLTTLPSTDVCAQDSKGRTPLNYATLIYSPICIKAILDCCPNAVTFKDNNGRTALHFTCAEGSADCVRALLACKSCDIHSVDNKGTTPLHWAAAANQPGIVQLLLRRGADRGQQDNKDMTPLDHARQRNHNECVRLLENYGLLRQDSSWSIASQFSIHPPTPPELDEHGHVPMRRPSASRPPSGVPPLSNNDQTRHETTECSSTGDRLPADGHSNTEEVVEQSAEGGSQTSADKSTEKNDKQEDIASLHGNRLQPDTAVTITQSNWKRRMKRWLFPCVSDTAIVPAEYDEH